MSIKIQFHGAAGDVTGAAFQLTTRHASVLVDCGLYQGSRQTVAKNSKIPMLARRHVDAVVVSHAHLDHIGRLPLLTKRGYTGPIFGTQPTFDLGRVIMRDALRLQVGDLERENRRRKRAGQPPLEPLYDEEDVRHLGPLLRPVRYDARVDIAPGVSARFVDAGHILGSASIELTVEEDHDPRTVVFSGDLGPRGSPLLGDPVPFQHADVVVMESTYGDRNHRSLHATALEAREIVRKAVEAKAKILVPVFAIGRTQLLLYLLASAFQRKTLPPFPIYVDSPMAVEATQIYGRNTEIFDAEARAMLDSGELQCGLQTVHPCVSAEESRALNTAAGPCMIMAGSGMCSGGRIMHHLRHNLDRPETAVLMVGYQSPGSLGRRLVDGEKRVTIFGEKVTVRASIHTLGGFSAHAGQDDLVQWFASTAPARPQLILAHGEARARQALARRIESEHGIRARCPDLGDVIEI
jgi:metallo-beta-lactamase family protein